MKKGGKLGLVEKITLTLAQKIVFKKIVDKFGGRLKYAFSGGAALSREVAEFVDGLGITVYEGYGLTETSPIATVNRPGGHRIGSVGQPLPGVKIVIDKAASGDPKHGEIIVYGENVMMGYHNRDEEKEHFVMTLEWLRRNDPKLDEHLRTYLFTDSPQAERQILGMADMSCRVITARVGGSAWKGFCRGTEVTLTLDEDQFVGSSAILFAHVMSRFLGLYANLNTFTQLVLRSSTREEEWKRCPPMVGEKALL